MTEQQRHLPSASMEMYPSLIAQLLKESACNAENLGSFPGLGSSPEEVNGNPLQFCFLENPHGQWSWWATVHGVTKSQTRLSD